MTILLITMTLWASESGGDPPGEQVRRKSHQAMLDAAVNEVRRDHAKAEERAFEILADPSLRTGRSGANYRRDLETLVLNHERDRVARQAVADPLSKVLGEFSRHELYNVPIYNRIRFVDLVEKRGLDLDPMDAYSDEWRQFYAGHSGYLATRAFVMANMGALRVGGAFYGRKSAFQALYRLKAFLPYLLAPEYRERLIFHLMRQVADRDELLVFLAILLHEAQVGRLSFGLSTEDERHELSKRVSSVGVFEELVWSIADGRFDWKQLGGFARRRTNFPEYVNPRFHVMEGLLDWFQGQNDLLSLALLRQGIIESGAGEELLEKVSNEIERTVDQALLLETGEFRFLLKTALVEGEIPELSLNSDNRLDWTLALLELGRYLDELNTRSSGVLREGSPFRAIRREVPQVLSKLWRANLGNAVLMKRKFGLCPKVLAGAPFAADP